MQWKRKAKGLVVSVYLAVLAFLLSVVLGGCDQWAARTGFGKMSFPLPCGQRLVNATWKGRDGMELWYLTRPLRAGEAPETSVFQASTLFGIWEGRVDFTETACGAVSSAVPVTP
jgi:hypothetical protein